MFPKLDAQIFYNIDKPPSYHKFGLTPIKDLPAIKYNVDSKGNLISDKLSVNVKDYLKMEKIGDKIIGRVKFNVASKSLGDMTLRFSDVKLNNGSYCFVYTNDYQIVAGPIYQKSINDMLNIVKIPANELVLEIISNSEQDYNLIFSSISFQSIDDFMPKSKYSLQDDETDWDCNNSGINGNPKYFDNISQTYSENSASYLGAWYDCDLLNLQNLYSVNDEKIAASRASCIIMEPPHFNTESPFNWIDYWGANSGTLMNFPESDCEGIIFTSYHLGFINQICALTVKENNNNIFSEELAILNNTIIRFNWHHKYGKPIHLTGCSQNDFALWRKTIDFDEVIDYCGVRGVAYVPNTMGSPDYAILEMNQPPFYKELHLGWTTQRIYDFNSSTDLNNPEDFSILGRHGATPTYLFKNSGGFVERMGDVPPWAAGIQLKVIDPSDPPLPPPPPLPPRERSFSGWSGSQLLYPYYNNPSERIGLGITKSGTSTDLMSYTYRFLFYYRDCYIIDTSLTIAFPNTGNDLYNKYLKLHTDEFIIEDDFYWMPSKENKEKCPSPMASETEPCDFYFSNFIKVEYKDGKMYFTINIAGISPSLFPGGQYPKGIRIYRTSGDQQTFFFDTFADNINIGPTIEFTINPCDLFYYQMLGENPIQLGFDFYDADGKILNATGCNISYSYPFPSIKPCEQISITKERIIEPPLESCCTYNVCIALKNCDDYSNIVRLISVNLLLVNITNSDTSALSSQNGLIIDYLNGKISFNIPDICDTTSFKLIGLFGENNDCESFDFTLDCVIPESPCDCCKVINPVISPIIGFSEIGGGSIIIKPHEFLIDFSGMGNRTYQKYCPECQFVFAEVFCPNPNPSLNDSTPILEEIMPANQYGFYEGYYGSFDGYDSDTYCFYFVIHTSEGICYDTLCVDYDGTNWALNEDPQGIIIEIDKSQTNSSNSVLLPTDFDYEKVSITDLTGRVILESNPINKIDVSNMTTGTYYILYRKKDKVINSQKLIIKK